jgi:hypothetical protein
MTAQDRLQPIGAGHGGTPLVVVPLFALILNGAIIAAATYGYNLAFPVNILGGFSFVIAPLFPAAAAIVIAFGLWRYGGLSQGAAWLTAIFLLIAPIITSFAMNYLTGLLLANLSDAAVTNSQNFYFILFLKGAASAASVLLVMAIASPLFRRWQVWLWVIVLWAGGDTLLFGLFRNGLMTPSAYHYVYPVVRMLGFIAIGYELQRPARRAA